MPPPAPIIGIDLGTTNSLVAVANWPGPSAPRILYNDSERPMLPSAVRYDGAGNPADIGDPAKAAALLHPLSTITSVKRLMGRSLDDAAPDAPYLAYRVVAGPQNTARVAVPLDSGAEKVISPQEVSAAILRALKARAERALGVPITRAVITVPAYFDDAQRQATRDAGRLAGLEVVRIINEPTAAALAYGLGLRQSAEPPRIIVVYDLGGGTFDVSILRITGGDGIKGSRDQGIKGKDKDGIVGSGDRGIEKMRTGSTPASIPFPHDPTTPRSHDPTSPHDPTIPRSHDPTSPLDPIPPTIFQVLSTAGDTHLGGDDFDNALQGLFLTEIAAQLSTPRDRLLFPPETREALRQFAESAKVRLSTEDSVIIRIDLGAGRVYQRTITRAEFESLAAPLVERTIAACRRALRDARRKMEDEPITAVILVGGASRTPLVRRRVAEAFGLTPYTALNPDEVVALGAAVQASVLSAAADNSSDRTNIASLLLDVVPLSLGIETVGGAMAKLIMRNAAVPARAAEMFSTSVDNQTGFDLTILQGEREMAQDCRTLARLALKGIPPMPAGIPKLRVEFLVDASGILTVHAAELRSGKRLEAQVVPNHGLTQGEVERMERESLTHARDDMAQHRITDLIANSKLDAGWIERQLARHAAKLDPAVADALKAQISKLKAQITAAETDWRAVNPDTLHAAKEALDRASIPLHELSIAESLRGEGGRD